MFGSNARFVTREPILIFSQIRNVKYEKEKKENLNKLLDALRKKLPEGFKIGAAMGGGDCFFDSVAQGLNELRDNGMIACSRGFSVKSLRESCKQYAQQVNQSEKGSWLDEALRGESETLCEYIPRIEFTAEDMKDENFSLEREILRLENAVWGRPEVEGKIIGEKYGIKIKIIELRDEEIDGLHVTKAEVGEGHSVYVVNYRNHFIPVLSNIEKDIKKSTRISREEAYGTSNTNISTPLQDVENFSCAQSGHSKSKANRKRGGFLADRDDLWLKKPRTDWGFASNKNSDGRDKWDNIGMGKQHVPHHLIGLMYRLDLSVLCLLRKSVHEDKYPSLTLTFDDSEMYQFQHIVLRNGKNFVHVQIENLDKYCVDNSISYAKLFSKEKRSLFFVNDYLDSFVRHLTCKSKGSISSIEYLVVYTNSCLELTEEGRMKKGRVKNFYPLKFDAIGTEGCEILKDFFYTNDHTQGFYRFSRDEVTRQELLKRLEFSLATQKIIHDRKLSQQFENGLKEEFLDKLIFAVDQPNREKLNGIVKDEIQKYNKVQYDYVALQEGVIEKLRGDSPAIGYKFNLIMFFLHRVFSHEKEYSVNLGGKSCDVSEVTINHDDRTAYVKAHHVDGNIGYIQLFPAKKQERRNTLSVNKHFSLFVEELKNDVSYIVVYVNAALDLTEDLKLKRVHCKGFHPLKFDSVDMETHDILKDFLLTRDDTRDRGFYQFSQDDAVREEVLKRLEFFPTQQKSKDRQVIQDDVKKAFLDKLVFAVDRPGREGLSAVVKSETETNNDVPYNYGQLHEIVSRCLESRESCFTKTTMNVFLEDIKNHRSSFQEIAHKNTNEEIKFARSVVGRGGTFAVELFLDFLTYGEGEKYLEVLKKNEISLTNTSSILHGAGDNAVKAFEDLYNCWFDEDGNKMQYLKSLEEEGMNLGNLSSILHGSRADAAKTFKDLYDLWFDSNGTKTQYLTKLEENGVDLVRVSSILSGAGVNASRAFKDLYDLWFDGNGQLKPYLTTLEHNGVDLARMSSILSGAGANASRTFKDLYLLWFDGEGIDKTQCLKVLEKEGISLSNVSSVLHRAGNRACQAFKDLYNFWFDEKGNKTVYLQVLEKERIHLSNVFSILHRAGSSAAEAFKDLYDAWFDEKGNKKQCLKVLEENGIDPLDVSTILGGAGANAAKVFQDLYDVWFDEGGNQKPHLKHFTDKADGKKSFTLYNLSSIVGGTSGSAAKAFERLHSVCFNEEGKRTQLLDDFYNENFQPSHLSYILCKTGVQAYLILKRFHAVCFNEKRESSKILTDFYDAGFRLNYLCSILSGAADNIEKFHHLCFNGETKKYLNDFLKEGFSPNNLSNVLNGARNNICSAFKEFHDFCFNDKGERAKALDDFYKAGFTLNNLSVVLSMVGNNASCVLRNFHESCFGEKNYLTHFFNEETIFTPENLCKLLYGAGTDTPSTFDKLHDVCFDKVGNKTDYLDNLVKNNPPNEIIDILYKTVIKAPCTFFDDVSRDGIEKHETDDPSCSYKVR